MSQYGHNPAVDGNPIATGQKSMIKLRLEITRDVRRQPNSLQITHPTPHKKPLAAGTQDSQTTDVGIECTKPQNKDDWNSKGKLSKSDCQAQPGISHHRCVVTCRLMSTGRERKTTQEGMGTIMEAG